MDLSKFNFNGPLGSTSKIQDRWSSGKHNCLIFVTTSKHVLYSLKKKKNCMHKLRLDLIPSTKRYVSNLPRDSVHILIHNMIICIFIYMHLPRLNTDCKVRCLFHTLTFAFQALPIKSILLTSYFATRI